MEEVQLNPLILTTRLYGATVKGDVNSLIKLLHEDPFILDRCIIEKFDRFIQSPLHVASSLGHFEFTTQLLSVKPELATQLDQSSRSTALHLAAAKGHLEIVKKLLDVNPNTCLARDQDGRNPLHVAAINGQLQVLDLLVATNPHASRERTNYGETILHLCVKYKQFEALEYLVNAIDDSELLNATDKYDNTVLHFAVVAKHLELVRFLVKNKKLQQRATNKDCLSAIEWLIQNGKSRNDKEILETLKRAIALEPNHALKRNKKHANWLKEQCNALVIVASLITTIAFQIGVNPPGGTWQEDSNTNDLDGRKPYLVGTSIMAHRDPLTFQKLQYANTVSLVSSLTVVLLFISGIPFKRLFVILLMIIMCVAITTTTMSYYFSLSYLTEEGQARGNVPTSGRRVTSKLNATGFIIILWAIFVAIGFIIRVFFKPMKTKVQQVCNMLYKSFNQHQEPSSNAVP